MNSNKKLVLSNSNGSLQLFTYLFDPADPCSYSLPEPIVITENTSPVENATTNS
jgi:hypothetical protein